MTPDAPALQLLADCVDANVRGLQFTTDALLRSERARARALAEAYVRIYDVLDSLPDAVLTVALYRQLQVGGPAYAQARALLDDPDSDSS